MQIDNEKAIECLKILKHDNAYLEALNIAIQTLEEHKKGIWINTGLTSGFNDIVKCSVCGHEEDYEPNYCPNCGAKMKYVS